MRLTEISLFLALNSLALGQTNAVLKEQAVESHGTCAAAVVAPFGEALVIDSRLTFTDKNDVVLRQEEGCKIRLASPTILLAGVGLEDTTGRAGKWNSLDSATDALRTLSNHPTEAQLDKWGTDWMNSLIRHFRSVGDTPGERGVVAEMLLLTKVDGSPYFRRTTVEWDGAKFDGWIDGQVKDKEANDVEYSGACRSFMNHTGHDGTLVHRTVQLTIEESIRLDEIGKRKMEAKTTNDLADAAYSYALLLTDVDTRLEGDKAVIAAPYAHAQWSENQTGWTVHLNPKCQSVASSK
jgi:hypothetical protein